MSVFNRFSEHYRIDQYLKKKNTMGIKSKATKKHENLLSNFPVGLIILVKDDSKFDDKVEFINNYACKLFRIKENIGIKELQEKFSEFVRLKNNKVKMNISLKDIIFNYSSFNLDLENFVPFECTYSKNIILYIKINEIDDEKYIVIDKYDKFIEEQKYIELNLIKTINYQYLHTLYHELNNPLNALLAIAGENEKSQIFSSEISKSDEKTTFVHAKSIKASRKSLSKRKKSSFLYLNNADLFEKPKKKYFGENSDLNNKIPLLVNIIKIFIKNFILYLKIRADSLLSLKNEFDAQNETSDIMNAVELSEYEKEITKHKSVKINLEYIFQIYLEKFKCLFNYKEIDYETNFEKLKNTYVITDEFNFIYYIRQIYTYLYYIIPKKDGFIFEYEEIKEYNSIKIIIRSKNNGNGTISRRTADPLGCNNKDNKNNQFNKEDMAQVIQTKEMTKEVLYVMSKKLCFYLDINDIENSENSNNNIYLSITMPIHKKDKSEEEDEFKDEDINEMIQKNSSLLESKLKRQIPAIENMEHRRSNNSLNYDSNSRIWKDSNSSMLLNKRKNHLNNTSDKNLQKMRDDVSYICPENEKVKKFSEKDLSHFNPINFNIESKSKILTNNKSTDNFLDKCLKIAENKKPEKDIKDNNKHERKSENFLKLNINTKTKNSKSDKGLFYNNISQKSEVDIKSQKMSGVFTKINNLGHEEELNYNDLSISKLMDEIHKKKDDFNCKYQKPNATKTRQVKENKLLNSIFNMDINAKSQNSTNVKSSTDKQNSKSKGSIVLSDVVDEKNSQNINININNNNIINIINNDPSIRKSSFVRNRGIKKNTEIIAQKQQNKLVKFPEVEKRRLSQNITPAINTKECMTFFGEEKRDMNSRDMNSKDMNSKDMNSKDKKTIFNDSINQNGTLFLEANKEREIYLHKNDQKNPEGNNIQQSGEEEHEDEMGESVEEENEEEEEENEENGSNNFVNSEEKEQEEETCNCFDILVVDDEEFNVMASQKMMKKLGYGSDAAYNGEECINLIKEKQKLNCKCNRNYYKIIFLDIVMPVLDGIKTAKKIQSMIDNKEINNNIKIIFISGNIDGDELKKSLLQIDCVKECLQKPVKIDKYQKIFEKYHKDMN
jgi:CheY-like chemotaxis protein